MINKDTQSKEKSFVFSWEGKEKAYNEAFSPTHAHFSPHSAHVFEKITPQKRDSHSQFVPEQIFSERGTSSLLIEGDNLEAIKLLRKHYSEKIKMIYIDPPYNTKSSRLLYDDNFILPHLKKNQKKHQHNQDCDDFIADNIAQQDINHRKWLNFMLPRLALARELVQEDGAIFISIDDKEYAYLKVLLDEIWGMDNFVNTFVWNTTKGAQGMKRKTMIVSNHEYVVVYAKNINAFSYLETLRSDEGFSNPDNDSRGPWKRQYLQRIGQGLPIRTIVDPDTNISYSFESPYKEENLNKWIQERKIVFPKKPHQYPMRKEFLYEYKSGKQHISALGLFPTKATTEKMNKLFDGLKIFTSPKPLELIMYLIQSCTSDDDTILDFFAGSGTTAHAVMQLNKDMQSDRKFLCIQNSEQLQPNSDLYLAGYKTIFDICAKRIRKVWSSTESRNKIFSLFVQDDSS